MPILTTECVGIIPFQLSLYFSSLLPSFLPLLPPSPSLEGVGFLTETIDACFSSHPRNEEGAVQAGLTRWSGGQGRQPPTWEVLISAMEYAKIAQQHIPSKELHPSLIDTWLHLMEVARVCGVCVCMCVCVCVCV